MAKRVAKELAPKAEKSMNLDYDKVFFPQERLVVVMQRSLEKELAQRCSASGGSCGAECQQGAVAKVQAASQQSFKHLAEKHGPDGWRHGAYMAPPESTFEEWRAANPISPMHEDEAPVSTDKHAAFH